MIKMKFEITCLNEVSQYMLNSGLSNTEKKYSVSNGTEGRVFAKIKA